MANGHESRFAARAGEKTHNRDHAILASSDTYVRNGATNGWRGRQWTWKAHRGFDYVMDPPRTVGPTPLRVGNCVRTRSIKFTKHGGKTTSHSPRKSPMRNHLSVEETRWRFYMHKYAQGGTSREQGALVTAFPP